MYAFEVMAWQMRCEAAYQEARALLEDAQKVSDTPFHGASLKTEEYYTGYDVLNVESSDALSPTEWGYVEGPCEIHDLTIRPNGNAWFTIPAGSGTHYFGIDRSHNVFWNAPRAAVEGDIYPYAADVYWLQQKMNAAVRSAFAYSIVKNDALYRLVMQSRRDELTGTG